MEQNILALVSSCQKVYSQTIVDTLLRPETTHMSPFQQMDEQQYVARVASTV